MLHRPARSEEISAHRCRQSSRPAAPARLPRAAARHARVTRVAVSSASATAQQQQKQQQQQQPGAADGSSDAGIAGLAQYRLLSGVPELRRRAAAPRRLTAAWLEAAVQAAVRHIGAAAGARGGAAARPFLLLVAPRPGVPFATVPLSEGDMGSGWAGVAAQVGSAAAQGVLLVRPLPEGEGGQEPAGACVASGLRRDCGEDEGGACSDCAAAGAAPAAEAAHPVGAPASASALITGRVGECCGGGAQQAAPPPAAPACVLHAPGRPRYYGVVVQGPGSASPDGCYLLKTTHAASTALGCACSHYALTRVSKGPSFHEQLTRSWTV